MKKNSKKLMGGIVSFVFVMSFMFSMVGEAKAANVCVVTNKNCTQQVNYSNQSNCVKPVNCNNQSSCVKLTNCNNKSSCVKSATNTSSPIVISKIKNQKCTGKALKPCITVKAAGKKLKEGKDYTVKYSCNKKVGVAKVIVKCKGSYCGTAKTTFNILKKK